MVAKGWPWIGKPGFVSQLHHSLISLALDNSLLNGDTRGTYLVHCREDLMSLVDAESLAVRGVTVNGLFPFGPTCPRTSGKGVGGGYISLILFPRTLLSSFSVKIHWSLGILLWITSF